ncbi:luciferase domain-containing protein [Streptomyces kronopolitis]|uniref:luciferase domain-containing protein n=1 Tax=Streptomyces kronopolitis TaxID=1612435 RepID=UPI0036875444
MTPASRAIKQFVSWPDLTEARPSCGIGRALRSSVAEIAHFHSDRSADLHLTAGSIHRIVNDLAESSAIRLVPGSHWVTVRLDSYTDVDLLMTLMSLALQAHQRWPHSDEPLSARCNEHLHVILVHEHDGEC